MSEQMINSFLEVKKQNAVRHEKKQNLTKTRTLPKRNINSFLAERQKVVTCSDEIKLNYG